MENHTLLRRAGLCISAVIAILIFSSCSNKSKTSDRKTKEAERTVVRPAGAIPLSAILQAVENAGYTPVVEVEFEEDHWKIKGYKDGQLLQLKVGLMKGEILPNPAPTFDKPLSAVIKVAEDQGYGPIVEVEAAEDGAGWDVEAYKGNSEVNLRVEPGSGKITTK
jgi:hypothetical protein